MVYNCSDDVIAAFIAGLQTYHSFYKHLVKQDITNMKYILSRAQKYVQLEEVARVQQVDLPSKRAGERR